MEHYLHHHHQTPFFRCEETLECEHETSHMEDFIKDPPLPSSGTPPEMTEQGSHWDPEELRFLLFKQEQGNNVRAGFHRSPGLLQKRDDTVEWIMKVHSFYNFSATTAVLAVDYLDRFLLSCFGTMEDKPWMTQLTAVACLSIASKLEESRVPLLVGFQVVESSYVFEAKNIQRMEVVVLNSLRWRMNPVTPLSFVDFAMRRFAFKDGSLSLAFRSRCEQLLLSVLQDCGFVGYLPSVLAAEIMIHVLAALKLDIDIFGFLGVDKGMVGECYEFVLDVWTISRSMGRKTKKRKSRSSPGSPRGVMDVWCSSSDSSSNDSWAVSGFTSVTTSMNGGGEAFKENPCFSVTSKIVLLAAVKKFVTGNSICPPLTPIEPDENSRSFR